MKVVNLIWLVAAFGLLSTSCRKEAGPGGKTTIKGFLQAKHFCSETGEEIETVKSIGERVYISYGGGHQFDNDVRTGTNGYFEFRFMNPGKYRVTALSECDNCPSGVEEISTAFEVSKGDDDADIGTLEVKEYSNGICPGPGEGGTASATGLLEAVFIDENNFDTLEVSPLLDERVYLIYGEGSTHSDDIRSSYNGTYSFPELRIGKYTAFAYSDCVFCPNEKEPVTVSFEVTQDGEQVSIPKIKVIIYR